MAKIALDLIEEAGWHPEPRLWRDDAEECSILAAIPADAVEQIAKRDAEIVQLRQQYDLLVRIVQAREKEIAKRDEIIDGLAAIARNLERDREYNAALVARGEVEIARLKAQIKAVSAMVPLVVADDEVARDMLLEALRETT